MSKKTPLDPRDERYTMGRIAAAIWAAIAFFGAVATVGKLRPPGADVQAMHVLAISAAALAVATLIVPWTRLPRWIFNVVLVLMSGHIGALAYASGVVRGDLTVLFTFVVVFAAYFLSWRMSVAQLVLIGAFLSARLFMLDERATTRVEVIRLALLLPALIAFMALVSVLRKSINEREQRLRARETYDYQTGLLSADEFKRVLESELSRAARHARPLSLVELELSGRVFDQADLASNARVVTMIARAILGRIRVEDRAARLDTLRFAVIAPETDGSGAAVVGHSLVDVIRKRLLTLGYENESFAIAVGWADYPHGAQSMDVLLEAVADGVATSVLANETTLTGTSPDGSPTPSPTLPAAAADNRT